MPDHHTPIKVARAIQGSPLRDRLLARISIDASGCWLWQGRREKLGYGNLWYQGRGQKAHRLMYELTYGAIPEGMKVCHRCDVRFCVNPAHLFLGTQKDNVLDMNQKQRGNHPRGERQPAAKLTDADVREIRRRGVPGWGDFSAWAREFGVSDATIRRVTSGSHWRHIA